MLTDLIARYGDAKRFWEAQWLQDETLVSNSPEWDAYVDLSCNMIDYRCMTMEEVSPRAAFMLADSQLVDMLANCSSEDAARDFLRSMILEAPPVDNSGDNGDNRS